MPAQAFAHATLEHTSPGFRQRLERSPAQVRLEFDQGVKVFPSSIQVMDARERLQGYLKADLQDVVYEKASMMPAFPAGRLSDSDLNDLVGYLSTLRNADVSVR